jgi:tRNA threonylcarbamoyladenosine biosynthesis protein TsaE
LSKQIMETHSREETLAIGRKLGEAAQAGEIYALVGDLGTGKTVFSKGFAEGLGVTETVSSPTFTILQIYEDGRLPLYHFDVYRIEEPEEMEEVGLDEYLEGDGVCLIEWPERIAEMLPAQVRTVRIEKDPERDPSWRRITISDTEGN